MTWTGRHRVFDLEVRTNNTFVAGGVAVHNCQDLQYQFLEIIHETLSGSPWALKQYTGTPKSLDNTMEKLWEDSSQAEWAIKCRRPGCGHWNIPALHWDLMDMIGPWHRDIGEKEPGVVCAKCRKPVYPRTGRWVHAHPERRWQFAGYHVPQIIMPMHYADHEKWDLLVGKMQGRGNMTITAFLNEVCGESCDTGAKLLTATDLKEAAVLPWKNDWRQAVAKMGRYTNRVLAVDWGGGGGRVSNTAKKDQDKRLRTSYTTMAVMGRRPDGKIDVIWGHRSLRTHDYEWEARLVVEAIAKFRCTHLVHDYGGAGAGREVLVRQAGFPYANIIPVKYHGSASHNIMVPKPATEDHPRDWYSVDKSRSLVTTCMCIKYGLIRFFEYDHLNAASPGLLHDFLSLIEEKVTSRLATDAYYITSNPNAPDDFAQAVNIGACALWYMNRDWPDIAEAARFKLPPNVLAHVHPVAKIDWDDLI